MASEAATLYKLMLLYILNKVDFEITNTQLTEFLLEKQYTNYFHVQTALSELVEEDLCRCKKIRNSTYYKITEMGRKTLGFFKNDISESIRQEMDD
jgi:predicted transcriptional regulator